MKFFFPDSQDQIDPDYDFETETRAKHRIRQRDDLYAHEVFETPPFSGVLVSMTMVDPEANGRSRYTMSQRHRFQRVGVRRFFRLHESEYEHVETMGDCGAFSYKDEDEPPYSARDVAEFYDRCGFDYGVSVDHIILSYQKQNELPSIDAEVEEWRSRQEVTLDLADEFLKLHREEDYSFTPVGIAQGWSPESYATAVQELQEMGYDFIGIGGMVPMRTNQILQTLDEIDEVRSPATKLHLFGISRFEHANEFADFGVASLDSTAPLKQAFKSKRDNYHTPSGHFMAIRIPQVDANNKLRRRVKAGEVDQEEARTLEQAALKALRAFDEGNASLEAVLESIENYYGLIGRDTSVLSSYSELMEERPWKRCDCEICRELGVEVVIFRGAERNKRRGFHNLYVFYNELCAETEGYTGN